MRINLKQGESLTGVLAGAVQATEPVAHVEWADGGAEDSTLVSLSGATAVTLLNSPNAAGRTATGLSLYNPDTAAVAVTISHVVGAVSTPLLAITVQPGSTLLVGADGVSVVNSTGQLSTAADPVVGAAAGALNVATELALDGIWNRTTLTLSAAVVTLADEAGVAGYGGRKVYDFPAGKVFVLSAVADLSVEATSAGVNADFDGDFALGTATASNNGTLTGTEADVVPSTATPQADTSITTAAGESTGVLGLSGNPTAPDLFLNFVIDDADQDITGTACDFEVTGTITIVWAYLGP